MSVVRGADGRIRCEWGDHEELRAYHDEEWGRPVRDERGLFERVSLEAFQSGLSWRLILRKRDAFRRAFAGFDPAIVAAFDDADVERLCADAGIVRNRAKIEATIANARVAVALGGEFPALVWSFAPVTERPRGDDVPATTQESEALAAELRHRGFKFVGPTTAYALMQAAGMVDGHVAGCEFGR